MISFSPTQKKAEKAFTVSPVVQSSEQTLPNYIPTHFWMTSLAFFKIITASSSLETSCSSCFTQITSTVSCFACHFSPALDSNLWTASPHGKNWSGEWPIPFSFPLPECWRSDQVSLRKWRIHGNNGNQESWAIEAVCRRLGYAGLKPDHEKAVRSFGNGRDVLGACQPWMQRSQLSRILRESHAFHLQLKLSHIAACFSPNQAAYFAVVARA